jgi:hypothetical protein
MRRERVSLSSSIRLADSSRKTYNYAGGRNLWRFIWTFTNMPGFWVEQIETWFEWNKGTPSTAAVSLQLKPSIRDFPNDTPELYTVDIEDLTVNAVRRAIVRDTTIGYAGSIRYAEVQGS